MDGKHGFVYAPLAMVVPGGVAHRAFSGLVDAGGYRVWQIEDVGLVG